MQLEKLNSWSKEEFSCEITDYLNSVDVGIKNHPQMEKRFKHYILDTRDLRDRSMAIRVPGRTVGIIELDECNQITRCEVDNYLTASNQRYPSSINEDLKKFIGVKLEID